MLSEKPWNLEAIVRLLVGVFMCVIAGATVLNAFQFSNASAVNAPVFFALVASVLVSAVFTLWMVRRPWPIEKFARHFMVLLVCVYLVTVAGSFVQHFADKSVAINPIVRMIVAAISFQGAVLVMTWMFLHNKQVRWADAFGFGNDRWRGLMSGAMAGCFFFPIGWSLQWISVQVLSRTGLCPVEQETVQTLKIVESAADRIGLAVIVILLVPMAEEILFRGLLYPTIKQSGFPRVALWSTALLFAVVHQNVATFLPLFVLALVLTVLYEKTNNLIAPIAAHGFFNAINFAILYWFQSKVGQPPGP